MGWLKGVAIVLLVLLAIAQFIRPSRTNPPIDPVLELKSVPPELQPIFARSCNDCHSNRTVWPWYSNVAPVSWLVAYDVSEGRRELNFSQWGTYNESRKSKKLDEICREVRDGDMPGALYTLIHRGASLTKADAERICGWIETSQQAPPVKRQ